MSPVRVTSSYSLRPRSNINPLALSRKGPKVQFTKTSKRQKPAADASPEVQVPGTRSPSPDPLRRTPAARPPSPQAASQTSAAQNTCPPTSLSSPPSSQPQREVS